MFDEEEAPLSAREIARRKRGNLVRRPRFNSKLDYLSDEQHALLCEWLLTANLTYGQILVKLENEFGVHSHRTALTNFYKRHVAAHQIAQRHRTLNLADEVSKDISQFPGNYTQSTIDALEEKTHNAARDRSCTAKDLNLLTNMCLRYRAQIVAETKLNCQLRELAMAERREKRAAETLRDSQLNPEQKFKRLKEIFHK
jgi:hypothetical protein